MNITTLGYLIFLFCGGVFYYIIPQKHRWKWLIVLSFIYIYSASTAGIAFVILTSLVTFLLAKRIEAASEKRKRSILIVAFIICFGILILLKYISALPVFEIPVMIFGNQTTVHAFVRTYLLPIGLSYYTLQVVSYLLDVYWGRLQAEQNYLKILLFTCYFPQMVQGPISKYSELAPELFKEHPFQWKNIKYGVQLMLWGFFKKMVIADRIGVCVSAIFYENGTPYGLTVVLGLICYGIQLYCDFSGGIDVIRGVSELFGIGMKDNFYQPYFSHSLGEFWRRWHISLGQWVKDYMFYPVSMSGWMGSLKKFLKKIVSRKMSNRIAMALSNIVVFAFVGVWHGLGTNFLGWGLYNGIILAISVILTDVYAAWKKKLKIDDTSKGWHIFTLARTLVIVTIGWVFDCASTASGAGALFLHMFWLGKSDFSMLSIGTLDTLVLGFGTISLLMVDILHEKGKSVREMLEEKNYWIQLVFWTAVIQLIACFGRIASAGGFMYANF